MVIRRMYPFSCRERTKRRKAMETAMPPYALIYIDAVGNALNAERQWRLGVRQEPCGADGRRERTKRRKAMETSSRRSG